MKLETRVFIDIWPIYTTVNLTGRWQIREYNDNIELYVEVEFTSADLKRLNRAVNFEQYKKIDFVSERNIAVDIIKTHEIQECNRD